MALPCQLKPFLVLLFIFMLSLHESSAVLIESCPSLDLPGSIITRRDTALKGHVRQSLPNVSWVQCSLRCQRQQWCISINFQITSKASRCELNDYGVQDEMSVSAEGQFERTPGYVYTQLRPDKGGCQDNGCRNGGTCVVNCARSTWQCHCKDGYSGELCEQGQLGACSSNPCQNGGSCTDQVNGYICTCVAGYTGLNCETDIDDCLSSSCHNGGTCHDGVNGYTCTCVAGYTGSMCQVEIVGTCFSNPCQNGGTCHDKINGYNCTCVAGYTGPNCETLSGCELSWPSEPNTGNYISKKNALVTKLTEFTVSFWIKVPNTDVLLYPFSYATSSVTSAFLVGIKSDGTAEITVRGSTEALASSFTRDDTWQHCAVTWQSTTGDVILYHNGVQKGSKAGFQTGQDVPIGGSLYIGQYQGSYEGGFDSSKLMVGKMADLNIWSTAFTAQQIVSMSSKCFMAPSSGRIVSWTEIIGLTPQGALVKTCPTTCPI